MFEFARELKRMFASDALRPFTDGMTGGDSALLELLDLRMLLREGKAADVSAGRISARDKPQRRLEAAIVWREVARRSGDPASLRKAAASAEIAAIAFDRHKRPDGWARARCEQAYCAMLGAQMTGDQGLDAAAEAAFREARAAARGGLAAALADIGLAAIEGRARLTDADADQARAINARFAAPVAALETLVRRCAAARPLAAEARIIRADLLCGWGGRLRDHDLLAEAIAEAGKASASLDNAYEPLTWARAETLRAQALVLSGETTGDVEEVAAGVHALTDVLETLLRDHSPLDWAHVHVALGQGLQALAEAGGSPSVFTQAITCFDRADVVLRSTPAAPLRGAAASARAVCMVRQAELTGDLAALDAAEMAMKIELTRVQPRRDPVGWALAQTHLARLYEARLEMTGRDRGERSRAVTALDAALDVFAEHGLRSLSAAAVDALERLKVASPRPSGAAG